jgi:hypothetical protein
MTRWEYRIVHWSVDQGNGANVLNEMGGEGWELVSETVWRTEMPNYMSIESEPRSLRWTFKRPVVRGTRAAP